MEWAPQQICSHSQPWVRKGFLVNMDCLCKTASGRAVVNPHCHAMKSQLLTQHSSKSQKGKRNWSIHVSEAVIVLSCLPQATQNTLISGISPVSSLRGQLFKKAWLPRPFLILHVNHRQLSAFKTLPHSVEKLELNPPKNLSCSSFLICSTIYLLPWGTDSSTHLERYLNLLLLAEPAS